MTLSTRLTRVGMIGAVAVVLMAVAPASAGAIGAPAPDQVTALFEFPSSDSTVVGSLGFIDEDEVGHFWSAARGDLVSETFSGPRVVRRAILRVEVVRNVLSNGAYVDWDLEINGVVVGSFTVNEGFLGPIRRDVTFPGIAGPTYDVTIRVTNEVAPGEGSHTLAYAGSFAHSIKLLLRRAI